MGIGAATTAATCAFASLLAYPVMFSNDLFGSLLAASASSGCLGGETALEVDAPATEPAVPLNLSLKVCISAAKHSIEIAALVSKRFGYPADMFFDKEVMVKMTLPPGLELEDGTLTWSGNLKANETGGFTVKVRAVRDLEAVVEVAAEGQAQGGRVDADRERFHISVSGDDIRATLGSPAGVSPLTPGSAVQVQ
jgi:hypothetical protein